MSVFEDYAAYYDALYRDKDYTAEAGYVDALVKRHCADATEILELGCGTGQHALILADRGYRVTGIDRSEAMVRRAIARKGERTDLDFAVGDLTTYRAGHTFDAVLALFHVISYQTSNEDLAAAMATAAAHLRPGGVFVFDCWYGPGVLTSPPQQRVRRLEHDDSAITRIAEPTHFPNENRVDVHYEIMIEHGGKLDRIREVHAMRYLFVPEVRALLESVGMKLAEARGWLTGDEPSCTTWNACFVGSRCGKSMS